MFTVGSVECLCTDGVAAIWVEDYEVHGNRRTWGRVCRALERYRYRRRCHNLEKLPRKRSYCVLV